MYKVNFSRFAEKQLFKLDKQVQLLITSWLKKNIDNSENPRLHGKALKGDLKGKWRYRIGDYRVICLIKDEELIVLAISIGHRRDIYLK